MSIERKPQGELQSRTKAFALRIIRLSASLPRTSEAGVLGKQILRSGTSVGANYREATRARTPAEFRSKLLLALQEMEETTYWLELLVESGIVSKSRLANLSGEARELTAMLVSSVNTTERKLGKSGKKQKKT